MILLSFAPAFAPAAAPPTVAAVQTRATVVHETPAALALLALPRILGDQKVMIQVGVVVGAIGIFWLTRSIK